MSENAGKIPGAYRQMKQEYPALMEAYEAFGGACAGAGPLTARELALVKLGISMGAGLGGAVHSHSRKAMEAGWSGEALEHAAMASAPTVGFPTMMRNLGWVRDVTRGSGG